MNYESVFFLTGLVSSVHCIGMCGTFSASIVARSSSPVKLQIIISTGRFLSYVLIGAFAGAAGSLLFYQTLTAKLLLCIFSISAGVYGILLIRGKENFSRRHPRLKSIFTMLIPVKTPLRAFAIGMLTPLLPCPVLHAALALAILSGGMVSGGASMAFFAAGTAMPLVISSIFIEKAIKKTGALHMKTAGCLILLASFFSLGRLGTGLTKAGFIEYLTRITGN